MPSARISRAKRKLYYVQNIDKIRKKQKDYYKQTGKTKASLDYKKIKEQPHVRTRRLVMIISLRKRLPRVPTLELHIAVSQRKKAAS